MTGTLAGGKKSLEARLKVYGKDHQAKIGAKGGKKSKGRKITAKTRRKISQSLRRYHANK